MSKSSQIFQIPLNWPYCAPVQVSRILSRKDSTFRHSMTQNLRNRKVHVEYTLPWSDKSSVTYRQGRCGVDIMINSPFGDGTRSWVRIVNGINKYVTEMSEETRIEDIGESTANRPKQTPSSTLSSATIPVPYHERKWIDVEPGRFDKNCLSKLMISVHNTSRKWRCMQIARPGINISFRSYVFFALVNSNMAKFLAKRRWKQEEIPMLRGSQFTWKSSIPSINSRPFWKKTHWSNIARQRVVTERLRRAHLSRWTLPWVTLHRPVWVDSGWENVKKGRHAVFLSAVNRSLISTKKSSTTWRKPRIAVYKKIGKYTKNTVYGCNLRPNAIILLNTLHALCIEKVVNMKSREEFCSKLYQSPKLPQRTVRKPNLHHGREDTTKFGARASVDHLSS